MAEQRDAGETELAEISVADSEDFPALYAELRGVRGIDARAILAPAEPGEQSVTVDIVTVALSSGAVTTFLEIIKTLLASRGPGFVLKIRRGKQKLEITADNAQDALPLVRELFNGS